MSLAFESGFLAVPPGPVRAGRTSLMRVLDRLPAELSGGRRVPVDLGPLHLPGTGR
jgi:hypothetical protein